MDNLVNLKFDLEIPTQRMLSQVILNNKSIEKQIEEGLEKAVKELTENDNSVELVKIESELPTHAEAMSGLYAHIM